MSLQSRLAAIERKLGSTPPHCSECGRGRAALVECVTTEDETDLPTCVCCGLSTTLDGRPLAAPFKRIVLGPRDAGPARGQG